MPSEVMNQLWEEHRNIARVLNAMEHQLEIFKRGEQPDYDVFTAAAEYFTRFPDLYHHPKEDLVFRKLRERDPAAIQSVGNLESEHEAIARLVREFREAVQNVLEEVEVSRDAFSSVATRFISEQRRHMAMEEESFFPHALEALTDEDWSEIDSQKTLELDPLFGTEVTETFEPLLRHILKWEQEDEAQEA